MSEAIPKSVLKETLDWIARQKTSEELERDEDGNLVYDDFEGAYDYLIELARNTLGKNP